MLYRPEYDENGKKILCEMKGVNSDMLMDIYVKKLKKGEILEIYEEENETAILLLSGRINFKVADKIDEIGIEITGLRPGEKLYEELSTDTEIETRRKTSNEKIYVNQPDEIDTAEFEEMLKALEDINNDNVRDVLIKYVKTYHPASDEINNNDDTE